MKVAVCIKAVPNPDNYNVITIDPVTKTIVREGIENVINPTDLHAIELGMQLKDKFGAEVTIITMAPPSAQKQLREALSYGADRAYLISDRAFGGADTLATSYTIAQAIKKIGEFDWILAGNESADGATTHVPSQVGEWLGFSHIMEVIGCEFEDESTAIIRKKAEDNAVDFRVKAPALLAVSRSVNTVRYPNMKGIMAAKRKPLETFSLQDFPDINKDYLGLNGSPTKNGELHNVSFSRNTQEIKGSSEEIAKQLWAQLQTFIQ